MTQPQSPQTVRVVDSAADCPELPIVQGAGRATVVIWPGNGALYRTFQVIDMKSGDRTIDLSHPSDAVYYIAEGEGSVFDTRSGESWKLDVGSMVHIDRGDAYRFDAGAPGMRLLGGPCPADPALYDLIQQAKEA